MKRIKLSRGKYAIVDDADFEEISKYKWYARSSRGGFFYAARMLFQKKGQQRRTIDMHRQILGLEYGDPRKVDHQNHNTLDNSRDNIRICTHQENCFNQKSPANTSSQFKGVSWLKRIKRWQAHIKINGKQKYLGCYKMEELAALAYDFAALKYHREFAYFNF